MAAKASLRSNAKKLTKNEKKMFLAFLDQLSEHQSNAGCNDFELPNTPENIKFLKAVIKNGMNPKDSGWELERLEKDAKDSETLITSDFMVLDYLRSKVEKLI